MVGAIATTGCPDGPEEIPPEGYAVQAAGRGYGFSSCNKGVNRQGEEGFLLKHKFSGNIKFEIDGETTPQKGINVSQFYRDETTCNDVKSNIDYVLDIFPNPPADIPQTVGLVLEGRIYDTDWSIHDAELTKITL